MEAQISALEHDLKPVAVKLGMLVTLPIVEKAAAFLKRYSGFVVCDPVMISSSETALLGSCARAFFIQEILPWVDVLTPNTLEAKLLTGKRVRCTEWKRNKPCSTREISCYRKRSLVLKQFNYGSRIK